MTAPELDAFLPPKWKPLQFAKTNVVKGGLKTKAFPGDTLFTGGPGNAANFVHIGNQRLFKAAAAGPSAKRGALEHSKVVEELRKKLSNVASQG